MCQLQPQSDDNQVPILCVSCSFKSGAARIGKLLAKFVDMGPRPDLVVTEWWPTGVAIVIEWIGLALPRIILAAVGIVERRPGRLRALLDLVADRWRAPAPALAVTQRLAAPSAAFETSTVRPSAATTTTPKASKPINPGAGAAKSSCCTASTRRTHHSPTRCSMFSVMSMRHVAGEVKRSL